MTPAEAMKIVIGKPNATLHNDDCGLNTVSIDVNLVQPQ